MKRFLRLLVLSFSAVLSVALPTNVLAQASAGITGVWQGIATTPNDQQIPITVSITQSGAGLTAAFLNGPANQPDAAPASDVSFDGVHLTASFDYYARKLDATLADNKLTGTYGAARSGAKNSAPTQFVLTHVAKAADPGAAANAPDISGSWEIATKSSKGEDAWEFRADPPSKGSAVIKTVIQRIDGDTGGLWGTWDGTRYTVSHFTAAGAASYSVTPQGDGTLAIRSLLGPVHGSSPDLIARRPTEARKLNLPAPTNPLEQTTIKDPSVPFAFSFPDNNGKIVSNTDAQFREKVVIVAVGGSWCPNCHDEALLLVKLYKEFHDRGLEIVNLDFEQGDAEMDSSRLHAFITHYGVNYTVLRAGTTDQLAEKIPQAVNLNCWPTSFFLGRDGLVKETHAGFAGPGNTAGHIALEHDVTTLIEGLLAQPVSSESSSLR